MAVIRSMPLTPIGVGREDYTGEQWRAQTFKRYQFKENETLKVFLRTFSVYLSPYPWVTAQLAPGATAHLIDGETGLEMPFTLEAGYELEILMLWSSCTEQVRAAYNVDGFLFAEFYEKARDIYYESEVYEFSTKEVDPTFTYPHTIDFYGDNLGSEPMSGLVQLVCVLREHGTEIPTEKTVKCKFCGNTETVPIDTREYRCPSCGNLNLYRYHPRGGKLKGGKR